MQRDGHEHIFSYMSCGGHTFQMELDIGAKLNWRFILGILRGQTLDHLDDFKSSVAVEP
jgi:hypothetical protein